jgi:hypothetical protein
MESGFEYHDGRGTAFMMQRDDLIIEIDQMSAVQRIEIRNKENGHIDPIAFDVPDIKEAFRALKNASFQIIEESPVFLLFWSNGCKYLIGYINF